MARQLFQNESILLAYRIGVFRRHRNLDGEDRWEESPNSTVPFGWRFYSNKIGRARRQPGAGRFRQIGRCGAGPLVRLLLQMGLKEVHDLLFVGRAHHGVALNVSRASSLDKLLGTGNSLEQLPALRDRE